MRKTTALIAALALLAALTGCSSQSGVGPSVAGTSATGCTASGAVSDLVKAPGKLEKAPTVKIPTPLFTKTTQKSTIFAGHGAPLTAGQSVLVDVTFLNGRTGEVLQKTTYGKDAGSLVTLGKSTNVGLTEALQCSKVGSRVAIVASAKDSHSGKADATNGIRKSDSLIYVVDIRQGFLAKANGANQITQNGQPVVVTAPSGQPGITIPETAAPKTSSATVLKLGTGPKVTKGSYLITKYTALGWTDKTVFDGSSWTGNAAAVLTLNDAATPAGISKYIVGKRVGSQVLLILNAKDAASSSDTATTPANQTVVYVIDILGTVKR